MLSFLNGFKTYIIVGLAVAVAVTEGFLGIDIPGIHLDDNWLTVILGGAGLAAIRHAIGK